MFCLFVSTVLILPALFGIYPDFIRELLFDWNLQNWSAQNCNQLHFASDFNKGQSFIHFRKDRNPLSYMPAYQTNIIFIKEWVGFDNNNKKFNCWRISFNPDQNM